MDAHAVLASAQAAIVDEAFAALSAAPAEHYRAHGEEITRRRLALMCDLVTVAVRDRELSPVIRHAEEVAEERFHAGYGIEEVQTAFNAIEVAMWRRIVSIVPAAELAEAIGLLGTVLGASKDALARSYVALASHRRAPALDCSALSAGAGA